MNPSSAEVIGHRSWYERVLDRSVRNPQKQKAMQSPFFCPSWKELPSCIEAIVMKLVRRIGPVNGTSAATRCDSYTLSCTVLGDPRNSRRLS